MDFFLFRKYSQPIQHFVCIGLILLMAAISYLAGDLIGYRVVSLLFLLLVSIMAMLFDIVPVLVAAALSALIWNFFFIPPRFTFHINSAENVLMFFLYFVVALVNAVFTIKIRKAEKKVRDKEEKENMLKLYDTLLNSLSHELRTPVATIIGATDTLRSDVLLSEDDRSELLRQVDIAGTRLNREVENLLNMSRLKSGLLQLNLDWVDIHEMIFEIINKLNDLSYNHTLQYIPDQELPYFKIDRTMIGQAIYNIVHNAVQHTPIGTIVKIKADNKNNFLVVSIEDNGGGIDEHELPLVFEKFYRSPQTKSTGSGLGLSISKGFAEVHGGTLEARLVAKGGLLFTFKIPAETSFINHLKHD